MDIPSRTLSRREAELVSWLEAERRLSVSLAEIKEVLGWPDSVARNTTSRLAKKGWLRRMAQGRYETLLAETGGWLVPNPWAALNAWNQRYYIGLKSAAYEYNLTPDRPQSVQVCVPKGAKRPRAWGDIPIVFIYFQEFDLKGVENGVLHNFTVSIASPEKIIVDGATHLNRMGGILGLARVINNAVDKVDWGEIVYLASRSSHGRAGLRRIAAMLEIIGFEVPKQLAAAAAAQKGDSFLFLGDRNSYGHKGKRLQQWKVVINVEPAAILEEVSR
jgi:predicted transcriptional regulator of viral defense system